jgi:ABC-type glycerol-3-phosphate transport system permease component
VIIVILIIIPIYTMFKYSISDRSSIIPKNGIIPLWPNNPTFQMFSYLMQTKDFIVAAYTSLKVSVTTVVISLLLGAPAAFILARRNIPGKFILVIGIISIRYFPDISTVIPVAELYLKLNLFNTWIGAAMAHTLLSTPYVIYISMAVFETIPIELEQQAMILGAGKSYTFFRIILPLAVPGLAAAAIYTFMLSWDEFIFAYFLLNFGGDPTLPVYLTKILTTMPQQNMLAATSVILSIPVIIFTFFVQKYVEKGLTLGAIK